MKMEGVEVGGGGGAEAEGGLVDIWQLPPRAQVIGEKVGRVDIWPDTQSQRCQQPLSLKNYLINLCRYWTPPQFSTHPLCFPGWMYF